MLLSKDIVEARSKDVTEAFFNAIKAMNGYSVTQDDIIRTVMKAGAPRFYVGYEKARRYVSLLDRGKPLPLKKKNSIAMYHEIYRRYKAYKEKTGIIGYQILEMILDERAPSYYIDLKTFRDIIYNYYKKRKICRSF